MIATILSTLSISISTVFSKLALSFASEKILTKLLISILKKLAKITTNTIDDEFVELIIKEMQDRNLPEITEEF